MKEFRYRVESPSTHKVFRAENEEEFSVDKMWTLYRGWLTNGTQKKGRESFCNWTLEIKYCQLYQ